jgi:hypothetical protein
LDIRRSKTDKEGAGGDIPDPAVAATAVTVEAWLAAAGIAEGPLFASGNRATHQEALHETSRPPARRCL